MKTEGLIDLTEAARLLGRPVAELRELQREGYWPRPAGQWRGKDLFRAAEVLALYPVRS